MFVNDPCLKTEGCLILIFSNEHKILQNQHLLLGFIIQDICKNEDNLDLDMCTIAMENLIARYLLVDLDHNEIAGKFFEISYRNLYKNVIIPSLITV